MRNLIQLFVRFSFFLFFLLLQVICFYLIFQNNFYQRSAFLNTFFEVSGGIQNHFSNATAYLNLKTVNSSLAAENAILRTHALPAMEKIFGENILINDTTYRQKYVYMEAKVISNSINKAANFLTIDKGSLNGIEPEMGVIGPDGIVGMVKHVSPHYATVISVLHTQFKASAKVKSTGFFGSMYWPGNSYRMGKVEDIPNHIHVKKNDTIVTTGYSTVFPEGINIGVVDTFSIPPGKNFYNIDIQYTQDYNNLRFVYVVKNLAKEEIVELEMKTTN